VLDVIALMLCGFLGGHLQIQVLEALFLEARIW
jgi:hypothetical protein